MDSHDKEIIDAINSLHDRIGSVQTKLDELDRQMTEVLKQLSYLVTGMKELKG